AVRAHLERGRSVLLVGPTGVGKTAILHGVACAMAADRHGLLYEISTAQLLSGTRYIGEWQTKVTAVARAAIKQRAALHLSDIWNLPRAGRTSTTETNMLDALRPFVEQGKLALVGEVSPEVVRAMQKVPGFVTLFQIVEIAPLEPEKVDGALA